MAPRPEVQRDWKPEDVWLNILEALDSDDVHKAIEARERLDEKYLVRGQLLVTPTQHAELMRISVAQQLEDFRRGPDLFRTRPPRISDIPVRVVPDNGLPIDLGGGLQAFYSAALHTIYVLTPDSELPGMWENADFTDTSEPTPKETPEQ